MSSGGGSDLLLLWPAMVEGYVRELYGSFVGLRRRDAVGALGGKGGSGHVIQG